MKMSKHHHADHSHHDGACGCALNPQAAAVAQNLDEMAFERGLWGGALAGDIPKLSNLLKKGYNPNEQDQSGFMPLHYAARAGKTDAVKILLQHGADANGKTRAGAATPLHRAAFIGNLEITKLLLSAGAKASIQDDDLSTPLHKAAQQNHVDVVKALLASGTADRSMKDKHGKTAFDLAPPNSETAAALAAGEN